MGGGVSEGKGDTRETVTRWEAIKGVLVQKIDIFKELTPRSRTYKLRGQGKKKEMTKSKTNKHLTLSYKIYLQKRPMPP